MNIIKSVSMTNFRSHERFDFEFHKKTTMIAGENGCGKTSVLEAIYEGCQGKSWKAVDKEIIRREAPFYRVEIVYNSGEKTVVVYEGGSGKKKFLTADKESARLPKKNKYPIILFEPDDLNLVGASPTSKRKYFDIVLSQLSEGYSSALSKYNKVLKQRNELLKEEYLREDAMFSWNVMLSKYGTSVSRARKGLVEAINGKINEVYRGIAENEDAVALEYETEVVDEGQYLAELTKDFARDHVLGHTSYGVHKDDYKFVFNGSDADGTASRGEIRSIVIALKFLEAELVEAELHKKPLVLLDDVFSELDEKRQKALAQKFKDNQVIITSVEGI